MQYKYIYRYRRYRYLFIGSLKCLNTSNTITAAMYTIDRIVSVYPHFSSLHSVVVLWWGRGSRGFGPPSVFEFRLYSLYNFLRTLGV